jgi:hypothetical protein
VSRSLTQSSHDPEVGSGLRGPSPSSWSASPVIDSLRFPHRFDNPDVADLREEEAAGASQPNRPIHRDARSSSRAKRVDAARDCRRCHAPNAWHRVVTSGCIVTLSSRETELSRVRDSPGDELQALINAHQQGSTFCFPRRAGGLRGSHGLPPTARWAETEGVLLRGGCLCKDSSKLRSRPSLRPGGTNFGA